MGQVEAVVVVEDLQFGEQAQGLGIALEAQEVLAHGLSQVMLRAEHGARVALEPGLNRPLALMAKGWVAEVVGQAEGRKQGGDVALHMRPPAPDAVVEHQIHPHRPREVRHLVRMGQAGTHHVVALEREDLGLVRHPPHRRSVEDAVVVALDLGAHFMSAKRHRRLGAWAAAGRVEKAYPVGHQRPMGAASRRDRYNAGKHNE